MSIVDSLRAVGVTAKICLPTVVDAFRERVSLDECDRRLAWWSRELLRQAGVELHVSGTENVTEGEAYVVMSNHRSYYDIPTVFCALPGGRLRMVAKKELFRVPVFGQAMLAAGFVKIDRDKRERAIHSLRESGKLLAGGTRVWIAPEGTRSKTGELGSFKAGGFHLAIEAGVRILPLVLEGTENVMPADGVVVHKGAKVKVRILPPIDAPSYGRGGRKALMKDVRAVIAGALGQAP
ncbi:MAG: 1-acyl-sn-glycerol-3-phosphate acyltransferase [Polyangiaceae bacterium]|nr:1-acyl-sn-glycerol-3-phosphate acyltransferase [Polyangiaceae bacterium]